MATEREIEKDLITDFVAAQDKITYFGSGSVIKGLLHSIARRLAEVWYDYGQKVKTLFLSSATADDLDSYGANRGVTRLSSVGSQVLLVFKGTAATIVPEKTQITGDHNIVFETQNEITISTDGGYQFGSEGLGAAVLAQCTSTGATTNVAENTVTKLVVAIAGIDSVTNPLPAYYGADEESDEEYRYRIKNQVSILNKTTLEFIKAACQEVIPDISRVYVEKATGENAINIYAITRSDTYLSTAQKALVMKYLNDNWVILPQVNMLDLPTTAVDVYMVVRPKAGYTLAEVFVSIADQIMEYLDFRTWPLGDDVESDSILQICLNSELIDDIDVPTFEPNENIEVAYNAIPMLNNITMVHMNNSSISINLDLHPSY